MKSATVFSVLFAAVAAVPCPGLSGGSGAHVLAPNATSNASSTSDWDYIVIGGGPAGIIVAQRLVESNKRVLLLERGGPTYSTSGGNATTTWDTKGLTPYEVPSQTGSIFSGGYASTCGDTPGTAGCLLGGGVSINAMVFVPPPQHDFDNWPKGWQWSDIEASAKDLYERNPGTITPSTDGKYYDTVEYDIMSSFLTKSFNFSSIDPIKTPDSKTKVFTHPPWNIQKGLRAGPVANYLPLAQGKSNFALQMYSTVVRVVRNQDVATGVEIQDTNTGVRSIINLANGGRVVLAAGSMTTPRLLANSGIGQTANIKAVQNGTTNVTLPDEKDWINLPIGAEIKDHPIINVAFNTTGNLTLYPFLAPLASDQQLFLDSRAGVLAQGLQRLIFWDSFTGTDGKVRYVQGTTSVSASKSLLVKFYLTNGLQSVGSLGVTSAGKTVLTSSPYLTNAADKTGLTDYIATFLKSAIASGIITPANATATAADYVVDQQVQGTHFVGTAKIGTDDGRTGGKASVDLDTKVYGMQNLFVVDASIHADLPTGNTQAIVMVVAEKAVKKILAAK